MIVFSKYLIPKGYVGLAIFPFVILKNKGFKDDVTLINHERIHLKQQQEMFIILFYVLYVFEFTIRLVQYKNWYKAYRNISFEREAYLNEHDLSYTKNKIVWSFIKYYKT